MDQGPTRRDVLAGFALAAVGVAALPALARSTSRPLPSNMALDTPENNLRQLVRLQGSLKEEDVPWYFNGRIFAIEGEAEPRPLVDFEGMEIYWMEHLEDGAFHLVGHTVTFFRDLETGKMLRRMTNPVSGETVDVTAAVQGGKVGFHYSTQGIRPIRFMEQMAEKPLLLHWSSARDTVWLHNSTVYPPGLPPPRAQRQTFFSPRKVFIDNQAPSLPASFSSTVFMPWLKWMNMGDRPGHVVWHAAGAKLRSIDELPDEFRQRAQSEHPERMTANPKA